LHALVLLQGGKGVKRLKTMFMVSLVAAGCGSSPSSPTPTPAVGAPRILAVSFQVAPSGAGGFTSPTSLTLQLMSNVGPLQLEQAHFKMFDAQGQILTEGAAATADVDRSVAAGSIAQTFRWPPERGLGWRIEGSLTYRDEGGELKTLPFSVPAR
jgi:hypothetical protein